MSVDPIIAASNFRINSEILSVKPFGEGNIHESFYVETKADRFPNYLLQHKNKHVFRDIPSMMNNISKVCSHLDGKLEKQGKDTFRHNLKLIPSIEGKLYYEDSEGEFWSMCIFIDNSQSYPIPVNNKMAESGGLITGEFHANLADFSEEMSDILPGFHNISFRFNQWDSALDEISSAQKILFAKEIDWIESRREEMLKFYHFIDIGIIPKRLVHNDAKLLNVLFDAKNDPVCLIDLDTVQYGSVLSDFGDAIRSYTNTAAEDEPNTDKIHFHKAYFEAYTRGYLKSAFHFLTDSEIEHLSFAPVYICFEQLLRFLMDFLEGNHYYKIAYPEHNLIRARAQFKLLNEFERNRVYMNGIVNKIIESAH